MTTTDLARPKATSLDKNSLNQGARNTIRNRKRYDSSPGEVSNRVRSFTLRVSERIIGEVDEAVSKHLVIRNRNTWIVNAIVEQLRRERAE